MCNAGQHRNAASRALHGFLTGDGIDPRELLRIGRDELDRYDTVEVLDIGVTNIEPDSGRFTVSLADGNQQLAHKVLLATGVVDELPDIRGSSHFTDAAFSIVHIATAGRCAIRRLPSTVMG